MEPEDLQSFEIAALRRYEEGFELMTRDKTLAGVYLMGYSAEMLLKTAFFRYRSRHREIHSVGLFSLRAQLGPAKTLGKRIIPHIACERYHSIRFWALLLIKFRRGKGDPLPNPLDQQLAQRSNRIYRNWTEMLRFQIIMVEPREELCFFEDVTWIVQNHGKLWR